MINYSKVFKQLLLRFQRAETWEKKAKVVYLQEKIKNRRAKWEMN